MADVSITLKTTLSDVFFYADEDNEQFDDWFSDKLSKTGIYDWEFIDNPVGLNGISELKIYVNMFDEYDHTFNVSVDVDNGSHSFDDIYDNAELLDYIEHTIAPQVVSELNDMISDIVIPMVNGSFNEMKFSDGEFFALLYSNANDFYLPSRLKNEIFSIDDYVVDV
jgi:hypothetical protein